MERRLSAIFVADMVGYSRLMEADEIGTLERQQSHRKELIDPSLAKFQGRIFKELGDGILVEFNSVVDAVQCAVDIQQAIIQRETEVLAAHRIQYRIGINLGYVIAEGSDLYGDGVNVAARLERLADPGGICISGTAYDHLRNQIDVGYDAMGEVRIKNIERPIRAYKVVIGPGPVSSKADRQLGHSIGSHKQIYGATAALLLALIFGGTWLWSEAQRSNPSRAVQSLAPVNALIAKRQASVAVLPFENKSKEADQLFFADGITDEIIINLTKIPGLLVIDRGSSFVFRDKRSDTKHIAEALGARYLLRGTVRRKGQDIRISASLVEGETGQLIWGDRYGTKLDNVFDLQVKIAAKIASELSKKFESVGQPSVRKRGTEDLLAYDLFLKGRELFYRFSRDSMFEARIYFEKAFSRDKNFAECLAMLAWTYAFEYNNGWAENNDATLGKAFELAKKATDLNKQLPVANFVRALVHRERREYIEAMGEAQQAIEADPNYANAYIMLATLLYYGGRPEEGLAMIQKAETIHPYHPSNYPYHKGQALFILKRYQEAEKVLKQGLSLNPTSQRMRVWLAATLVELGRTTDAEWEVDQILLDDPEFKQANLHHVFPFIDAEAENRFYGALKKAGFEHRF
ncbi:MAG: adenylate/guanylate cyclase domain-containing protein [Hyphomicrobiaceae bacterium]